MIEVYIGPNGRGKTTFLENKYKEMKGTHRCVYLPAEILLEDELKSTKDSTKSMEYILSEILSTDEIEETKNILERQLNNAVESNVGLFNDIIDGILSFNGKEREHDFISVTDEKEYKKQVSINSKDFKSKMGSGQKHLFLLKLLATSNSNHIFIDEPENYCHQSFLHEISKIINDLDLDDKNIYVATHSSKLVSMLKVSFENIYLFNENDFSKKVILSSSVEFPGVAGLPLGNFTEKHRKYYEMEHLIDIIKKVHFRDFIDCLFCKTVYIVEGVNDKLFLNYYLDTTNSLYDDYSIFVSTGKFIIPIFNEIFIRLGIDTVILFDTDDEEHNKHRDVNKYIREHASHIEFSPNIENHIGYPDNKNNTVKLLEYFDAYNFETINIQDRVIIDEN